MNDYTETVRKMRTSDLLACMLVHDALAIMIDSDGSLRKASAGLLDFTPGAKAARATFEERGRALVFAAAAELDRRIPIPEGS